MIRMRLFIIVVFGIFCLVSCNDNDLPENNKKSVHSVETYTIFVAPNTVIIKDSISNSKKECILIKYANVYMDKWIPFESVIDRFEYELGYEYTLLITVVTYNVYSYNNSQKMTEKFEKEYVLRKILEKTKIS
ncbi:DUF4377 domain-containing protein [Parabacteroides sp. AF18-52]|uniref:DUF4377 domain-containing protein n=1 Tax=Parabacteroides sp. AF18-52 TaxID=2292242 RepID=UPI000F0104D9|nr:DUF4377 domain-containing protein [Parabacteroides sp. AF18-52]RHR36859.1 DUF4377 domain-containing protein [Parabacteroides sp. AF18-52]